MTSFDSDTWNGLKSFWSKVQGQVRERNLFREHANSLRENTNQLFAKMKELRAALDDEFKTLSKHHLDDFMTKLKDLEDKISEGTRLNSVFDELKNIQRKFRDTKFTREHRAAVWDKLDGAFKAVKEKRYGPNANKDSSPLDRIKRRYDGLIGAIEKMERSIARDKEDLAFQDRKIANSDGQLEAQIRQAKIKMIEERIRSKEEKLGEMQQTQTELESRMEVEKAKAAKRAEQEKVKAAQKAAKEKIAQQIKQKEEARSEQSDELEKAAEALSKKKAFAEEKEAKEKAAEEVDAVISSVVSTVEHTIEDAVDTVKAVAEVVESKIEKVVTALKEDKQPVANAEGSGEEEE